MAYYVQSTVDTKINKMQTHSSRRAKTYRIGNHERKHNERDSQGVTGTQGMSKDHGRAASGTKDESMMARWCLQRRDHEQSTELTPRLGQWEETADT